MRRADTRSESTADTSMAAATRRTSPSHHALVASRSTLPPPPVMRALSLTTYGAQQNSDEQPAVRKATLRRNPLTINRSIRALRL